jgi:hypothetical protein
MYRVALALVVCLSMFLLSCGGNSALDDTEAVVILTVDVQQYNPDIDICLTAGFDVPIEELDIESNPKSPSVVLNSSQDVQLTRWVVTPYRTDGGSTASPTWSYDLTVTVPAGGNASLENYRAFPAEYFDLEPLLYLKPENGGVDPETGNSNIRQSITLQLFGRTISGKAVSTEPIPIAFNFTCN